MTEYASIERDGYSGEEGDEVLHRALLMEYSHIAAARKSHKNFIERVRPTIQEAGRGKHGALFISYYTEDFSEPAGRLIKTLDKHGLRHDIRKVGSIGVWRRNEANKAAFIADMVEEHRDEDAIVWVDADGEMVRYPKLLFSCERDIAFHWHSYNQPISCLVLIKPTQEMVDFCREWARESRGCLKANGCPTQEALSNLIQKHNKPWVQLPGTYASRFYERNRNKVEQYAVFMHTKWRK